jgi:MFS family permease
MEHLPQTVAQSAGKRNIVALGLVSMFNDVASEMAYPIVPLFLTSVLGAPVSIVGMIEGIAEATASILKVFSGWLSDRLRNRKRFAVGGYLLSAFSKVVLALAASWAFVLGARFMDRFGKGIRTAARDALIAESADPSSRASAFGLHRALDTAGAVMGPLIALFLLQSLKTSYATIFLIAALPAFVGVMILWLVVHEQRHAPHATPLPLRFSARQFGKPFTLFLFVNMLFALGNSSDAFLILRSQSVGYSAVGTVLLYVSFNVIYSLLSYPMGRLSDRFGAHRVLSISFFLFAAVYAGFGAATDQPMLLILFPVYGVYMAMSEGVGKAYIANLVPQETRGTALGLFYTSTGIMTLFSSLIAGFLWNYVSVPAPFYFGGVLSAAAGVIFLAGSTITSQETI